MVTFKRSDLILNFDRIRMDVTDFVRGNPLTAVAVGLGVPATFGGIAVVGRRIAKRRKKKSGTRKIKKRSKGIKRRTVKRRRTIRRKTRTTHSSPRHAGHKRVGFTTKDGRRVSFLVKKPKHSHKLRRR